jgi:hypothetical protein
MKLKALIVDLEMSPRAKRMAMRFGVPAFILGVATVAYAGVPVTFTAGNTLHAADLNSNFSYLDTQIGTLQTNVTALQASVAALQAIPAAPHFAEIIYNGASQTYFQSSANVPDAPASTTAIVVTRVAVGQYFVQWIGASFPNGVDVNYSLLNNDMIGYVTGFTEAANTALVASFGAGTTSCIYLETFNTTGTPTDASFNVTVLGK